MLLFVTAIVGLVQVALCFSCESGGSDAAGSDWVEQETKRAGIQIEAALGSRRTSERMCTRVS